jgi:hypothetical protein
MAARQVRRLRVRAARLPVACVSVLLSRTTDPRTINTPQYTKNLAASVTVRDECEQDVWCTLPILNEWIWFLCFRSSKSVSCSHACILYPHHQYLKSAVRVAEYTATSRLRPPATTTTFITYSPPPGCDLPTPLLPTLHPPPAPQPPWDARKSRSRESPTNGTVRYIKL